MNRSQRQSEHRAWMRVVTARQGGPAFARRGSPLPCEPAGPLCVLFAAAAGLCALALTMLAGCSVPKGPVFEPLEQSLVWPEPPATARISYVGSLSTDEDLNAGRSFGETLGQLLFGRRDPNAMATPYAITTDGSDRVFIADSNAQAVHVFDLERRTYERWQPGRDQLFIMPVGLAWHPGGGGIDGERLYVADSVARVIYGFDGRGNRVKEIASDVIERPTGLAIDSQGERLFVADTAGHQVVVMDLHGSVLQRIGSRGAEPGMFNFPTNVAWRGTQNSEPRTQNSLYVSDSLNFRVQVFDGDLSYIGRIGKRGNTPGHFSNPKGLALDSDGHLYVLDAHFEAVQIFDEKGRLLLVFGSEGRGPGQFWLPAGLHIDSRDRVWVADAYNRRVQVFQYMKDNQP